MTRVRWPQSMLLTLLLLAVLEVGVSLFSQFGSFSWFRASLHVVFVLFVCFRMDDWKVPVLILLIELVHGAFSLEGWEVNTLVGCLLSFGVTQLRGVFDLNTYPMTAFATFVFQWAWFVLVGLVLSVRVSSMSYFANFAAGHILTSLAVALLAPLVFVLLDRIWREPRTV